MDATVILFVLGFALLFFMAWNLGANDAASPCSNAVGAGVVSIRQAIVLFAIFAAIGALAQGHMNIKTVSKEIVPRIDPVGSVTVTLAACCWSMYCTRSGLEISNTYTVVGSVIGYALVVYRSFEYTVLVQILLSWIISPLASIAMGYGLYALITRLFAPYLDNRGFGRAITFLLVASLCFSAYSFGANDVGNASGAYVAVTEEIAGLPNQETLFLLSGLGAMGIAVGGLTWGPRVIRTVAYKIVRITALSGFVAELSNALVVILFVTVPYYLLGYGLPVSTSIVSVGAIIGTGLAQHQPIVDKETLGRLVLTWIITVPVTAIMSAVAYTLISRIVPL